MKKVLVAFVVIIVFSFSSFCFASLTKNIWPGRPEVKGYEVSVKVEKGWNIVPAIVYVDEAILPNSEIQKKDISIEWYYSTNLKKYFQLYPKMDVAEAERNDEQVVHTDYDNYIMTSGVWMYVTKSGMLRYNMFVNDYDYLNKRNLPKGINFVVFSPEMVGKSLWESRGSCTFEKAYFWERIGDQQGWDEVDVYQRIKSSEMAGTVLILKVVDPCILGSVDNSSADLSDSPPVLPSGEGVQQDSVYSCTDTDGGLDFFTKGAVYFGKYDYVDHCGSPGVVNAGTPQEYTVTEGDLFEYSCGPSVDRRCTESSCQFMKFHCPGKCSNGACVNI